MNRTNDSALWFFQEVVEPTVLEFLKCPDSMRWGCLAAIAISSMAEHFFHARPTVAKRYRNSGEFRGRLNLENWAFKQVSEVANATKHFVRREAREELGFDQIRSQDVSVGTLRAGWPITGREVMVEVTPKEFWLLSELIKASIEMWRLKLELVST